MDFDLQTILTSLVVVVVSLSVHEYAHARVAYALGDDTAYLAGRLTLNPLAHLDPFGTLAFIFARIGWAKPVPVNYAKLTRAKNMKAGVLLVSLAGPLSNLAISFVAAAFTNSLRLVPLFWGDQVFTPQSFAARFIIFLTFVGLAFYYANINLAIFNLLPLPPLDGSKILAYFLPDRLYLKLAQYERYIGMVVFALFIFGGSYVAKVMSYIATPFHMILWQPWQLLTNWLVGRMLG